MSYPLNVEVKESEVYLRKMIRKSIPMISVRLNMLLQIKLHKGPISQSKLSGIIGAGSRSIHTWRKIYLKGGIEALKSHGKKGSVSKIFGEEERKFLKETLSDPKNGIPGYAELRRIMNARFGKEFDYITLSEYCKRNFGTKIKVARKSRVKKDEKAVEDLKKTLLAISRRSPKT
jgi:transposase